MTIVGLLVALGLFCLVWWAATRIMAASGVGDPVATIVKVVLVVIFVLWLVSALGYGTGLPRLR